jgi:hypothetical protein
MLHHYGSELTKAKQFAFALQLSLFRSYKQQAVVVCFTLLPSRVALRCSTASVS